MGSAPDWAADITVAITTFNRPLCLLHLLDSLRQHYPFLPAVVADLSIGLY